MIKKKNNKMKLQVKMIKLKLLFLKTVNNNLLNKNQRKFQPKKQKIKINHKMNKLIKKQHRPLNKQLKKKFQMNNLKINHLNYPLKTKKA